MHNAYIAFLKPRTLTEKIVARIDGGKFCHCELMVKQNQDGTWQTISSLPDTGVRIRNVTLNSKRWVKVPVSVDADYCLKWYAQHCNANYDYLGLLTTKLSFVRHHHGKWFCSEAIADMLHLDTPANWGIKDLYDAHK